MVITSISLRSNHNNHDSNLVSNLVSIFISSRVTSHLLYLPYQYNQNYFLRFLFRMTVFFFLLFIYLFIHICSECKQYLCIYTSETGFTLFNLSAFIAQGHCGYTQPIGHQGTVLKVSCTSTRRALGLFHSLLLFHASILKPDFHLGFVQSQGSRNFNATGPRQIFVEMELFFQFCELFVGKIGASSTVASSGPESAGSNTANGSIATANPWTAALRCSITGRINMSVSHPIASSTVPAIGRSLGIRVRII